MVEQIISGVILIGLILAHAIMKPVLEMDDVNNQIIIHYWWKGTRKTYVIK